MVVLFSAAEQSDGLAGAAEDVVAVGGALVDAESRHVVAASAYQPVDAGQAEHWDGVASVPVAASSAPD